MKINNPFKAFLSKMREERIASVEAETNRIVNSEIVIANDKNDPENKIYVYVKGVQWLSSAMLFGTARTAC